MAFSGAVKIADVNDYLGPSQNCVKPLIAPKDTDNQAKNRGKTIKIELDLESAAPIGGHFSQIREDTKKKTATVSLNDCLACSGCITSAETVLITQQSAKQFLDTLKDNPDLTVVITLSPQARADLAAHYKLSLSSTFAKLTAFFNSIGAEYVFDASFASDIALQEAKAEFVERYKSKEHIPVLASECPGWVCYAEKTQGDEILPYISSCKSPQQVMGTLVKKHLAAKLNITPDKILHASVMPCYDKKLEGSRDDFYDEKYDTRDVDTVLTTGEILEMIQDKEVDFLSLQDAAVNGNSYLNFVTTNDEHNTVQPVGARNSGASGGYLDNIYRHAAKVFFGKTIEGDIQFKKGRNPDFKEVALEIDGKKVLRFARAYGFRNIQNIMRKLKANKCPYDYVEIMACPSGCLNGGGQIKIESKELRAQKAKLKDVTEVFQTFKEREPEENPLVKQLYADFVGAGPYSKQARELFHTQYHAVNSSEVNPLAIKW